MVVADVVRTTLGPRGMDKLIHDDKGNTTISNDGATIMKLLDIVHPAAKILVDIAKSQDSEVGDGTTTVVLLAGEFLKEAKPYIEDGVHPQNLIRSYRTACNLAIEKVKELVVSIEGKSMEEKRSLLAKCAATTLSSKLIGGEKDFFASMVVDVVLSIGDDDRLNMIGIKKVLGTCEHFEEKQVGNERFNMFSGCPSGKTATIVLRGGADQFIEEAERSLHDAIMIVRRAVKNSTVVASGGAIDMEINRYLRQHSRTIKGKSQLFINSYAKALEIIPRQLCDNVGFDATDVLNKLRQKHVLPSGEGAPYGVDINTGGIANSFANFVWEPSVVKINAINAATEACWLILSVDETVKNPKSKSAQGAAAAGAMGGRGGFASRGRGRGMRRR
nr:T-complex protein 1 subunit eta [Ipomoea batatas]